MPERGPGGEFDWQAHETEIGQQGDLPDLVGERLIGPEQHEQLGEQVYVRLAAALQRSKRSILKSQNDEYSSYTMVLTGEDDAEALEQNNLDRFDCVSLSVTVPKREGIPPDFHVNASAPEDDQGVSDGVFIDWRRGWELRGAEGPDKEIVAGARRSSLATNDLAFRLLDVVKTIEEVSAASLGEPEEKVDVVQKDPDEGGEDLNSKDSVAEAEAPASERITPTLDDLREMEDDGDPEVRKTVSKEAYERLKVVLSQHPAGIHRKEQDRLHLDRDVDGALFRNVALEGLDQVEYTLEREGADHRAGVLYIRGHSQGERRDYWFQCKPGEDIRTRVVQRGKPGTLNTFEPYHSLKAGELVQFMNLVKAAAKSNKLDSQERP